MLSYCTAIQGTTQISVDSAPLLNPQAEYNAPLTPETISVTVSANGIESFYWNAPVKVVSTDSENISLIAWEDMAEIIQKGLRVKNLWDYEDANVISRLLEIDRICLSYMQVRKDAAMEETYFIPVWDVIGTMHYRYAEDYVPQNGGFLVDENHERVPYADCSVLTINAIDGSIIDRGLGY